MNVDGAPLAGRVALITGAGRGIGRAIALRLARAGAAVAVNDIDADPAEAVAAEIIAAGGHAKAWPVSILDFSASKAMVEAASHELGCVDILVSNAGVASSGRSVRRTPIDEVEHLIALNAVAAHVLCRAALPSMRSHGRGDVVVISSTAIENKPPNSAPYNMAKAALEALASTLAAEELRCGIRVNIVAPGMTDTRLGRLVQARVLDAVTWRPAGVHGLGRDLAPPDRVAEAVLSIIADPDPERTGRKHTVAPRDRAS